MLDIKTAMMVKKAISEQISIDLDTVCRMSLIPNNWGSGYNILATQFGERTILVFVQFKSTGVEVRAVKYVEWQL